MEIMELVDRKHESVIRVEALYSCWEKSEEDGGMYFIRSHEM